MSLSLDKQAENLITQFKSETDPFNKAKFLRALTHDHELRLNQLSKVLSLKPSYLCHFLRLNRLPEIVIDGFYNKDIFLSHLFVISRLKDREKINEVYEKVLGKNLTVLETEELVREILHGVKTEGETLTGEEKKSYLAQLADGIEVKIIQTRIKSKLVIEVKGSLMKTTKIIRSILEKLKER